MAMTDTYIQPDGGISADERFSRSIEVKKKANSEPMAPEPTTTMLSGSLSKTRAWR